MENIRLFKTIEDYNNEKKSLVKPSVSYIKSEQIFSYQKDYVKSSFSCTWETNNMIVNGLGVTLFPFSIRNISNIEKIIINDEDIPLNYLSISYNNQLYNDSNYLLCLTDRERLGINKLTVNLIDKQKISTTERDEDTTLSFEGHNSKTSYTNISIDLKNLYCNSIGYGAFCNFNKLTSIEIPNSVTSIGNYGFANCTSLTSITLGNSVTSIDGNAFYNCINLTSIEIPNSVTSIGNFGFANCTSLTSIILGNSLIRIGVPNMPYMTFLNCSGLKSITCLSKIAPVTHTTAFQGIKSDGILYIPIDSDYSSWMNLLNSKNWTIQYI